ncbi:MAG: hypothetical protein ABFD91_12330 [Anaerohalosphaeraceae bacterium]
MPGKPLGNFGGYTALNQICNERVPKGMKIHCPASFIGRGDPCFCQIVFEHISPPNIGRYLED